MPRLPTGAILAVGWVILAVVKRSACAVLRWAGAKGALEMLAEA